MFLSDLSIKRPVFAAVMMLALVTLGVFSYRRLAVDMFPDVEIPVISIVTVYQGASPETVEREVSRKIEEAVNPIAGVKHVQSVSREGVSTVIVEFQLEVRINEAVQDARTKIAAIRAQLPKDIDDPVIQKFDIGGAPIISIALESKTMSPRDLSTLVDKRIRRRIENISGVGRLDVVGPSTREVNVNVDPERLQALGMGIDEVMAGLQSENVNIPVGRLNHDRNEQTIRISGRPELVEQFKRMVIGQKNGVSITLDQVGDVVDGIKEQRSLAFIDGRPGVALDILKQTGANTIDVVERVKKELDVLRGELPQGTTIEVVRDSSGPIRDSVRDVQETLIIGAFLTIVIVFLFLNSWRSTVITGLTLPISVISAFIVMNFLGFTLNVLTMMALSLAIGMLIDDAIVVRENIVRHLEMGKDHFRAAREGTAEIGLAVMATTLTIVAVFVPVAFMKGIVGRFFYQFGITITFAVLVSLFVSFTLDPMLSSRWVDPDVERGTGGKRSWIARRLDRFNDWFDRTADNYRGLIRWALGHRKTVLATATLAFVLGMAIFGVLEKEFMVRADQAEFAVKFTTSPNASIEETRHRIDQVLTLLKARPEVESTYSSIGAGDSGTVRDARIFVKLVPKSKRRLDQFQFEAVVRRELRNVPGIVPSVEDQADQFAQKPVQLLVRGEDIGLLKQYAQQLKEKLYDVHGITDIEVTLEHDVPEFKLSVDRDRAVGSGVMTADIVRSVNALVGGQVVSTYEDEDGDAIDVRVRLPHDQRESIDQVRNLRLAVHHATGTTSLVPLGELVKYEQSATPSQVDRRDLRRQIVVSANLEDVPLGTGVMEAMKAASSLKLAPGYDVVASGDAEQMEETFGYMGEALLIAIVFVYLILAAQFESFIEPLSIMLSLPLSIVGMSGALLITGDTINMMSLIGLIMLMGLVTKNAILLVDYAKLLRRDGMERTEALVKAGRTRLRPIMMTTFAMIFGMLPLALALGQGSEFRAPMARAVIGGLITSTVLTLVVVPVVYTLFDDLAAWVHRKWVGGEATAHEMPGAPQEKEA